MAMNPDRRVIDDGQLDEALRRIASAPVPADLPGRVLDAIHADVDGGGWLRFRRPAIGVVAFGVVLLVAVGVWMHSPEAPQEAQGSRHMAQGTRPTAPGSETSAHGSGRAAAPEAVQGTGPTAHGSDLPHRTVERAVAQSNEIEMLEPPEPLTVARIQMTELSERALQVDALHIPALEMETLER